MPALNFKKEFAPLVESGKKRQTIRQARKRPIIPGDRLFLYTGMRTDKCRKLLEVTCKKIHDFEITECGTVRIDSEPLNYRQADSFSISDGFNDQHEMVGFFKDLYGLPFEGVLIQW